MFLNMERRRTTAWLNLLISLLVVCTTITSSCSIINPQLSVYSTTDSIFVVMHINILGVVYFLFWNFWCLIQINFFFSLRGLSLSTPVSPVAVLKGGERSSCDWSILKLAPFCIPSTNNVFSLSSMLCPARFVPKSVVTKIAKSFWPSSM